MTLNHSVLEMKGAPPADFFPSRMLFSDDPQSRQDIAISNPKVTIGASQVNDSSLRSQFNRKWEPGRFVLLNLEVKNEVGGLASIADVPFEVIVNRPGNLTLSSEHKGTPWRFLVKVNLESREVALSFALNYAGLSISEALRGIRFHLGLAHGGEFRIHGRHPRTGGILQIASAAMPPGAYKGPDVRFVETLERLSLIESKTAVSFTIPDHNINFEEANLIAATERILETGRCKYRAKPWVSVSSLEQAKGALGSFASGEPIPVAVHFDGQVFVIFGTHVMLGPVTFFCDRTYITNEDLVDLRNQLDSAIEDSSVNIRFTPFEDCPIEARYLNWIPEGEAAAIRDLPMYQDPKTASLEEQQTVSSIDVDDAVALLKSWYDEDAKEQKEMWESIKVALDQDRLSDRKLFP